VARETTREGRRPERTVYEITPAGQDEFEDWLAELLSTPVRDFTSLEAGLSLMPGLPPDEVARLLGQRADRLRIELREMDAMFAQTADMGLPELVLVESRYRQRMLTAELEFVASLVQAIRDESFPGTKAWRRLHELRGEGVTFQEILSDPVAYLGEEARGLAPQPPDDVRQ